MALALVVGGALSRAVPTGGAPPPTLAGIQVGQTVAQVERHLGKPERKPGEIAWNAPSGESHQVALWQYGVAKGEADVADLTVTFLDGRVFQVGALDKGYHTAEGLHVGDKLAKATRLYGTAIEEDPILGLVPMKFLRDGIVVKVIMMPGDDHVLALGIESPKNLPALEPSAGTSDHAKPFGSEVPTNPL